MKTYILTKNDSFICSGTENDCYLKLQRVQSQSADWAIKYEGYKVEPLEGMHCVIKVNAYVFADTGKMKDFLKVNEGKVLKIDESYYFDNQYNVEGFRVFDTMVSEMLNDTRAGKGLCKYCGKLHTEKVDVCTNRAECANYGIKWFTPDNTFFLKYPKGLPIPKEMKDVKFGTYELSTYPSLDYFRIRNNRKTINFKFDGTHFFVQSIGWNQSKKLDMPSKDLSKLITFLNSL